MSSDNILTTPFLRVFNVQDFHDYCASNFIAKIQSDVIVAAQVTSGLHISNVWAFYQFKIVLKIITHTFNIDRLGYRRTSTATINWHYGAIAAVLMIEHNMWSATQTWCVVCGVVYVSTAFFVKY